jgi:hypothetical protein
VTAVNELADLHHEEERLQIVISELGKCEEARQYVERLGAVHDRVAEIKRENFQRRIERIKTFFRRWKVWEREKSV